MANYPIVVLVSGTPEVRVPAAADGYSATNLAISGQISFTSPTSTVSNLGLTIGVNTQAHDADLDTIAGLAHTGNEIIYSNAGTWAAGSPSTIRGILSIDSYTGTLTNKTFDLGNNTLTGSAAEFDAALQSDTFLFTSEVGTVVQSHDSILDSIASLTTASANLMLYTTGVDTYAHTPITTIGRQLLDDVDAAAMRSTLGVDQAGTDNSTNVTLAGSYDYLTLSGQQITLGQIDLTTDVTGDLPYANFVQATAASKLVGRGSAAGAGDFQEISLGTGLSMSGTTLSASASAPAMNDITDVSISSAAAGQVLLYDGSQWLNKSLADASIASNNHTHTINLASEVTGDLPYANFVQATAASKLVGRGSAAGAGDFEEITLGSGLTMTGTTLSASASAPALNDVTDVSISGAAAGQVLVYDGDEWLNKSLADASIASISHVHNWADINNKNVITITAATGVNFVPGNIGKMTANGMKKADHGTIASCIGTVYLATASISGETAGTFLLPGSSWTTSGLTRGATLFLASSGTFTISAPASGKLARIIGTARETTVLDFFPSADVVKVT